MPYVPVPKDLTKVKTKVAFNLTKRQLVCFGGGALAGIPAYILARGGIGNDGAVMVMIGLMLPFFLFGIYEKDGQPLENGCWATSSGRGSSGRRPGLTRPTTSTPHWSGRTNLTRRP